MTGENRRLGMARSSTASPLSQGASHEFTATGVPARPGKAPYEPPRLEALGAWAALTLQQSVPIGPGSFLFDPGRIGRLG